MKKFMMIALMSLLAHAAMAFPTWMGTYGIYKKHDDRANPGLFSIMMNQDYVGLHAEVGVQVNGGNWVVYQMKYVANVEGNSLWTFTPSFQFPAGAVVKYYFHGYDNWGGSIWDTRNGLNYEFTVSGNPEVVISRIADGKWAGGYTNANGITAMLPWNTWVDFKIKNIGTPEFIGMVWTWNNWAQFGSTTATFEASLAGGFQQWGVDLLPAGWEYNHRSLGFIRWYPSIGSNYVDVVDGKITLKYALFYKVNGTWYWDNNGGQDYSIVIGKTGLPGDSDNDGLLDTWETEYFGNLSMSANDNPDGDGANGVPLVNIIEQQTGNNPNVPNDPSGVRLMWVNAYPAKGTAVTLSYAIGNEGNPLFGKPIYAHVGRNGWFGTYDTPQLVWNGANSRYETTINVPSDANEINVVFTDKNGSWDNNGGKDWKILVQP